MIAPGQGLELEHREIPKFPTKDALEAAIISLYNKSFRLCQNQDLDEHELF